MIGAWRPTLPPQKVPGAPKQPSAHTPGKDASGISRRGRRVGDAHGAELLQGGGSLSKAATPLALAAPIAVWARHAAANHYFCLQCNA